MPSLLTLLLLIAFVQLGCWQLRRAAEKEALRLRVQQGAMEISSLETLLEKPEKDRQYQVTQLRGHFLASADILLDNQMREKKPGYRIFRLFQPEDSDKYLLIDRGWIPLGKDRMHPPTTVLNTLPKTLIQVRGYVDYPHQGLLLKNAGLLEPVGDFLRVQTLNFSLLSTFFKKPLYPFILRLEPQHMYAFEATAPQIAMPATKHLGYALQWFTMAGVTLIYFGIIFLKRSSKCQVT